MEPYSEHKPVPTTQRYLHQMAEREELSKSSEVEGPSEPSSRKGNQPSGEKKEMIDKMAGPKEKPSNKVNRQRVEHVVKDPTTGATVTTRDADFTSERKLRCCNYSPCNSIFRTA